MFRRETPVWANVFVCCEGEVRTGIPDPLEAQQADYNLDESVPLRSSACGWGVSPTGADELGCLDRALHSPRWEAGRPAQSLPSPPAPGGAGRWALWPALWGVLQTCPTELAAKTTGQTLSRDVVSTASTSATCSVTASSCVRISCVPGAQIPHVVQKCFQLFALPVSHLLDVTVAPSPRGRDSPSPDGADCVPCSGQQDVAERMACQV